MITTETPTIARRDQKHVREIAEGIIDIFNELGLEWTTGTYTKQFQDSEGHVHVQAACAVGVMRVKAEGRPETMAPWHGAYQLFGLTSEMCDGIIDGNDYGEGNYTTLESYALSNCSSEEPMASVRQKYADYLFGVKIGRRVRNHFRGEE
jgi:hypothetical protein